MTVAFTINLYYASSSIALVLARRVNYDFKVHFKLKHPPMTLIVQATGSFCLFMYYFSLIMTLLIMTLLKMTLLKMALLIMTLPIMTLLIMALLIMTLIKMTLLKMTLLIITYNDFSYYNNTFSNLY